MDKEIKEKWLKALRSGEYEQGREKLRAFDRFCCLGVLCDVVDSSKWDMLNNGIGVYNEWASILPKELLDYVELDDSEMKHLLTLNDGEKASFQQIANWIEENL